MEAYQSLQSLLLQNLLRILDNTFLLENISLVTGILYLVFLIKEKIIAWFFAFISSIILVYLYFEQKVYMQSILSIYYALMAIYGFYSWRQKKTGEKGVIIKEYGIRVHLIVVFVTFLLSGVIATILSHLFKSSYSTLDGFIFGFSIVATYLQVHKVISNWIYWIFINIVSILLLINMHLYSVALLMLVYLGLAIIGYLQWKKQLIYQK